MIFFFGTRASKIAERHLKNTNCEHCQTQDSFKLSTFASYFHLFWIPVFPLFKTEVAECQHCKKTYDSAEFSEKIKRSIERENDLNRAKRPMWHGCGCLIIVALIAFSLISTGVAYLFNQDEIDKEFSNNSILLSDLDLVTSNPSYEKDSISFIVKQCVSLSIEGIDTDEIEYMSKLNDGKLLLLLKVSDMKGVEKSSRRELMHTVEECLNIMTDENDLERYIGIHGNWNMLMVKTPYEQDLGGKFASQSALYRFYKKDQDSIILIEKSEDNAIE